ADSPQPQKKLQQVQSAHFAIQRLLTVPLLPDAFEKRADTRVGGTIQRRYAAQGGDQGAIAHVELHVQSAHASSGLEPVCHAGRRHQYVGRLYGILRSVQGERSRPGNQVDGLKKLVRVPLEDPAGIIIVPRCPQNLGRFQQHSEIRISVLIFYGRFRFVQKDVVFGQIRGTAAAFQWDYTKGEN